MTEIRPLIRSSDWGLWRGLSFLAGRDRGDRDVSRAPNPTAIRHTSAISDQLSVPGTGRRSAARCLSMSFIVPFPFHLYNPLPPRPMDWGDTESAAQTQTHTRERDEYSNKVFSTHAGQRGKYTVMQIVCTHAQSWLSTLMSDPNASC